ncbi:MAG TPA: hypothetical protein VK988_06390 [Acidimicrobiales bacterium]|nr:hypothetical protein [Acidimicrobiales bacterium]
MTALPDQLPLVPFNRVDEAVHVLETEAEPWSVQLEVRVSGTLDAGRLGEALTTAMELHPMARARKAPTSRRSEHRYAWEITPEAEVDPLRVLDCPDKASLETARIQLQSLPVPLVESPPFRVRLLHHPGGDFVMLNMNHAASDGFGSLHFLRSVGRAYAGEDDQLPGIDPLKARDLVELTRADDLGTRLRRAGLLLAKLWDLVVPPARLAYDGRSERAG